MFDERGCRHALMAADAVRSAPAEGGVSWPRVRATVARSVWIRVGLAVLLALGGLAYSLSLVGSVSRTARSAPEAAVHPPARSLALPAPGVVSLAGRITSLSSGTPGPAEPSERDPDARWPGEVPRDPGISPVDSRRPAQPADHSVAAPGRFWWLSAAPSTGPPLSA